MTKASSVRQRRSAVWRHRSAAIRTAFGNRPFTVGVVLLSAFVVLAVIHPLLMSTVWSGEQMVYRPVAGFDATIASHPAPPSTRHLLGTDALGRDVLSVLMVALRPTLVTSAVAAVVLGLCSVLAATLAAYFQRRVDTAVSLVADALILLPAPVVIILLAIAFPETLRPVETGVLYGILAGLSGATVVLRSQALAVMAKPFIEASRIAGGGAWHTIRTHLLPHVVPLAVVQMMAGVVGVIVATGFAQYVVHPIDSLGLGTMIYSGLTYQGFVSTRIAWNSLLAGSVSITLLAAGFYLVGFGVRQLLDPAHAGRAGASRAGVRAAPVGLATLGAGKLP